MTILRETLTTWQKVLLVVHDLQLESVIERQRILKLNKNKTETKQSCAKSGFNHRTL